MKKRSFIFVAVVVTLSLLLTGCQQMYHHGIPSCRYGNGPFQKKTWVYQGELHPNNPNYVCDGKVFVPASTLSTPEPKVEEPVVETEVTPEPTPTVETTEVPVEPTDTPETEVTEVPVGIGQIFLEDQPVGINLENGAVVITTGRILTGHDAPYSETELQVIETTPITYTVKPENGGMAVIFAYTVDGYTPGVIKYIGSTEGSYTVTNGEIIIWPDFNMMISDVANRIPQEIQKGNADFNVLAFHWISQELRGFVDNTLINERGVKILP